MTIRVLLADDERLVRAGFRMILRDEPGIEVIGEAADGREAVDASEQLHPDVVLMDIRMPNLNGIEATRLIVVHPEAPRVLVLTTFDHDEYVYDALAAGASGFLLKDAPEAELLSAIRIVANGGGLFAPSVTQRVIEQFARSRPPDHQAWQRHRNRRREPCRPRSARRRSRPSPRQRAPRHERRRTGCPRR